MSKLVLDIETIGEDFNQLDQITQETLTRWIKKESTNQEEYRVALEDIKNGLGFSPLTGQIVALGILDIEKNKGAVYYQAPNQNLKDFEENDIKFKAMSEEEMLKKFWQVANDYEEFITFNGRGFDAPFLMIRSAVHQIKPSKDLMSHRYDKKHIDLMDVLSFYGAVRRKGSLHLYCRAFGIKSPKTEGITGDTVNQLFKEKKFLEIAKYNVGDLYATKELYHYWDKYLRM